MLFSCMFLHFAVDGFLALLTVHVSFIVILLYILILLHVIAFLGHCCSKPLPYNLGTTSEHEGIRLYKTIDTDTDNRVRDNQLSTCAAHTHHLEHVAHVGHTASEAS